MGYGSIYGKIALEALSDYEGKRNDLAGGLNVSA